MPVSRHSLLLALSLAAAISPNVGAQAPPGGLDGETLEATLIGEYALQAGRLAEAADGYLRAARSAGDDAGLAERATRIALLANDNVRAAQALGLWKARAPLSLAMRAAQATLALRTGDNAAARRELESMLRDRTAEGWRYAFAALGSGARDPRRAAELLGQLVDAQAIPDELQPWLAFGGMAQRLGDDALTERIVADVIRRFPDEPRVALLRASQLRESGKPDAARAALARMASAGSLAPELRLAIAGEYDALGDPATAAALLSRGPQDERIYRLRAALLAKAEDKAGLAALYDELKRGGATPDPSRRLLLGQVAEFLDRFDEALDWYRGVAGGPARAQARLRMANVLHEQSRSAEAFDALRALQSDASLDDDARRDAYLLEAELHLDDTSAAAELDAYVRGLAAFPDDGALLYARGLMWERRNDVPRAEADLRRILVVDPGNVAALNALGYTLADRTTRYAEALELIDRARVAEPDNAAIIDSYGWVLYRLGRRDDALVELRRALSLQKDAEVAAHLAEVLWFSGKQDEARRYFDLSRGLDAENPSLQRALEKTGA